MLAIFTPQIGGASETFVRRHIEEIAPGRTVVVCGRKVPEQERHWDFDGPTLDLGALPEPVQRRQGLLRIRQKEPTKVEALEAFLQKHGVRQMMIEYLGSGLHFLPMLRQRGIRPVHHAHGFDLYQEDRAAEIRIQIDRYALSESFVVMSEHARSKLAGLGIEASRIRAIPYGVAVPDDPPASPHSNREQVRICAIGRMVPKKAPVLLLDAVRRAMVESDASLHFDLVGGGPLATSARDFVDAHNLGDRVSLHGVLDHTQGLKLLEESSIFVQHSQRCPETGDCEGMPVAILEAMAAAKPVVSTRHSGIPEAVIDGETGFLVDEGDTIGMGERIVQLAQDRGLRARMGRAGWERARDHFSADLEIRRLREILEIPSE